MRVPFVPGFNDAEMDAIIGVLRPLRSLRRVKILPYHNYADSKYRSLGLDAPLPDVAMPDAGTVRDVVLRFRRAGLDATDQTGDPPAGEETP